MSHKRRRLHIKTEKIIPSDLLYIAGERAAVTKTTDMKDNYIKIQAVDRTEFMQKGKYKTVYRLYENGE